MMWKLSLLFALPLLFCGIGLADTKTAKPNIIFIFIDDMGYADVSCFGNPHVKTPNIDQLATDGIKLTNFYVNSPICSPSRVSVTTGQYPARWKIYSYLDTRARNRSRGMRDYLDAKAPTTARKLKAAGYATAHFGKWHIGGGRDVDDAPLPSAYGFDESLVAFEGLGDRLLVNPKNSSAKLGHGDVSFCKPWEKTEKYTDRAIDFIRRNKDKPFYLHLFPNDVHDPHVPWPGTDEKWKAVTKNPWEQTFFAVLEEMDKQIGRLVDEIDQLGLAEETLIVFTSDNGPTDWAKYYNDGSGGPAGFTGPFLGRKWSLYEGGIRMPFIARWKRKIPAGITDNTSVMSGIDLSPTFCKVAGIAAGKLDGYDYSEVLFGKPASRPAPLFWQYGAPHAELRAGKAEFLSPSFAVRDGDWKLLANPDGSDAQLFHLPNDPSETKNLLASEPQRAQELFDKIKVWAKQIDLKINEGAILKEPEPSITASLNRQLVPFRIHGVTVMNEGYWKFSGKDWLHLPRRSAPKIAGAKWHRINATIETKNDGVIMAQGGNKNGYALYLKEQKLHFTVCIDGKRNTISVDKKLSNTAHAVEVFWPKEGDIFVKIDNQLVERETSPGSLKVQPGDSMQIGADLTQPVGNYQSPNAFSGTISDFKISYGN